MRTRIVSLVLTLIAAVAAFTVITGCGSNATLEKYFQDHPDEWSDVEDELKDMGGEMFTVDLSVKDNQITQIMTYKETFDADSVAQMKEYFTNNEAALREEIVQSIATIEKQASISGVTWLMQYNNGDGTEIFSLTIDNKQS